MAKRKDGSLDAIFELELLQNGLDAVLDGVLGDAENQWCGDRVPLAPVGLLVLPREPGGWAVKSDFPHTTTTGPLLKAYPDALCVGCHTTKSLP